MLCCNIMQIETTPDLVSKVYTKIKENIIKYRKVVNRPLTLTEKILVGHLDDIQTAKDSRAWQVLFFLQTRQSCITRCNGTDGYLTIHAVWSQTCSLPTTVHCDHLIQAKVSGEVDIKAALDENSEVYKFLESLVRKFGLDFGGQVQE